MKFKAGDKVKVRKDLETNKKYGNMTYIEDMEKMKGKTVTIKEVCWNSYWIEEFNYNWTDEMFEEKVDFTKSDLKDGDIVTYRNGNKRYVDATNKKIVCIDDHHCLSFRFDNFIEDLTDRARDTEYDIIKVERPSYEIIFERKEEILDEVEKRYLRNVIRPFRKDIKNITKFRYSGHNDEYFIKIRFENNTAWNFPDFTDRTMYKNMEADRNYTLKELGL